MTGLGLRLASAAVALAILAGSFFFLPSQAVFLLIYVCISLCQWEYSRLSLSEAPRSIRFIFIMTIQGLLLSGIPTFVELAKYRSQWGGLAFVLICFVGLIRSQKQASHLQQYLFAACFGAIYLGFLPLLLLDVLQQHTTLQTPLFFYLLVTVFAGDVFAYFAGLLLGEKKILPDIIPKKTVVGCLGCVLGSLLCGTCLAYFYIKPVVDGKILACCFLMAIAAQTGDFIESLLKRVAGKKDSGNIMPGHGGILDRLDGILFAIPVLYSFFS